MIDLFSWEQFCTKELNIVRPVLARLGFALDEIQPHLGGERAVISGKKLVLLGKRLANQTRVVIKVSSHPEGKQEMNHERACRSVLDRIQFAYAVFVTPEQLLWHEEQGCLITITPFLEQDCAFLERPLKEQFFFALKAFETQESAHATTFEHVRMIRGTFGLYDTNAYLRRFTEFKEMIQSVLTENQTVTQIFIEAETRLQTHRHRLEQYNGFLTHTDFVPHNFRIVGHDIYLLDHSAIRFGNKYDGWARFLNFMLLYHPELEQALLTYVQQNRATSEYEDLQLLRIYRLGELIWYYANRLHRTIGNLHRLDEARIAFWTDVLQAQLANTSVSSARILTYQNLRDTLRTDEEKKRQQGLH